MVNLELNLIFSALSDPTRRDILERLSLGSLAINTIAKTYDMSLVAVSKHLGVLERAKLISRQRQGKQYIVTLLPAAFKDATDHLYYYEMLLSNRLDSLEDYLKEGMPIKELDSKQKKVEEKAMQQKLVFTHTYDWPREQVWKAYTTAEHIAQWWSPQGSTLIACESDVRPGGIWRFALRGSDSQEYIFSGIFREVSAPERLIYTDGFGEATEKRPESLVIVTLEDLPGGKTKLTKTSTALPVVHQLQAALLSAME
jgi:uncharacterized protein YndB with AHSA1/START domain/DNA-binding transcriptional ArsR family regulator